MPAFTRKFPHPNNKVISTKCHILPISTSSTANIKGNEFEAIWDTGASASCIHNRVVQKLKLSPVSYTVMSTANGVCESPVFYVNILLPNNVMANNVRVVGVEKMNPDCLIGMDIISQGDFVLFSHGNETQFSFIIPPQPQKIDFLRLSTLNQTEPVMSRNAKCYCGSGKKFKHCHGQ